MPKFARVENGIVRELFDSQPLLTEELMEQLVELPEVSPVGQGWLYDGGGFTEPPPVPDPRPLKQKLKDLITAGQAALGGNPLPIQYRGQVYLLEAQTDIACDRNDLEVVVATILSFVIPPDSGLSEDQILLIGQLKSQMLQVVAEAN